ncbi:hypothetical protein Scep_010097 [Stephania cephalantha]|uniref:Uncharacterized protein n=1 Tax=Stephania cephalantha TaxID=152367 RepID=A0AAP0JUT7_9MAGN
MAGRRRRRRSDGGGGHSRIARRGGGDDRAGNYAIAHSAGSRHVRHGRTSGAQRARALSGRRHERRARQRADKTASIDSSAQQWTDRRATTRRDATRETPATRRDKTMAASSDSDGGRRAVARF